MDNPIFKLKNIVQNRSNDEMEDFEGPLDLILHLLNKNKIEIQDIPIAMILDQYLEYLDQRQKMDLEIASEFVIMAAHLMYIKTRMLLSIEDEEAQSEMEALIQSLEERQRSECYIKIKHLAECLEPMSEFGRNIVIRGPEMMPQGKIYEYCQTPEDLVQTMEEIYDRRQQPGNDVEKTFEEIIRREPYSVEHKAKELLRQLKNKGVTRFQRLFYGNKSRSELVATFMAVLELCRNRMIRLTGDSSECVVSWESDEPVNEVRT